MSSESPEPLVGRLGAPAQRRHRVAKDVAAETKRHSHAGSHARAQPCLSSNLGGIPRWRSKSPVLARASARKRSSHRVWKASPRIDIRKWRDVAARAGIRAE